jgi:dihydrofolate reductase
VKYFKAIAAMSENRVIGHGNTIPWHLPEDFRWFKQTTMGHTLVMGRKTFESIGRPLPGRTTVVLSRSGFAHPQVRTVASLQEITPESFPGEVFICGGAAVYAQALPYCSDLYLTLIKRAVDGDAFFPPFEDRFDLVEVVATKPGFDILHYRNRHL